MLQQGVPHFKEQNPARQEGKAGMPTISMDFCSTGDEDGVDEETKEDLRMFRMFQGDLVGGVALVVTDDWSRADLPSPLQKKARLKSQAEQVLRFTAASDTLE